MDIDLYRTICMKRKDFEEGRLHEEEDLCGSIDDAELYLRQDLAAMKACWTRDKLTDWWKFLCNMHPLLACFNSHRLHIVSWKERY